MKFTTYNDKGKIVTPLTPRFSGFPEWIKVNRLMAVRFLSLDTTRTKVWTRERCSVMSGKVV